MSKRRWFAVFVAAVLLFGTVLSPAALAAGRRVRVAKFEGVVTNAPSVSVPGDESTDLGMWTIDDGRVERIVEVVEDTVINEQRGDL
ncbi:MAG: hypothetical protein V1772_02800, partial [Chloroflexota bacterium]